MLSDDAARDYLLMLLAEPFPCQGCRLAARCEASHEACASFTMYVAHASELRWRAAPRVPTRATYELVFAEAQPAKAQMPKRASLPLSAEERRRRNTLRKRSYRERKQRWRQQQARDAAA